MSWNTQKAGEKNKVAEAVKQEIVNSGSHLFSGTPAKVSIEQTAEAIAHCIRNYTNSDQVVVTSNGHIDNYNYNAQCSIRPLEIL